MEILAGVGVSEITTEVEKQVGVVVTETTTEVKLLRVTSVEVESQEDILRPEGLIVRILTEIK